MKDLDKKFLYWESYRLNLFKENNDSNKINSDKNKLKNYKNIFQNKWTEEYSSSAKI